MMPGVCRSIVAMGIAAVFSPIAARAAAPLEAYGKLPAIEQVAISPDGADLAMIVTNGEERQLVTQHLADHKVTHRLLVGTAKLRRVQWAGPDHILVTTSRTDIPQGMDVSVHKRELFLSFDFNLSTGKLKQLMTDVTYAMSTVAGPPAIRTIDGKPVAFIETEYGREGGELSVYRIDLDHDTSTMVQEGQPETSGWLLNARGEVAAQSTYDNKAHRWTLKLKTPAGWRDSRTIVAEHETPGIRGFGRDGRSLLVEEFSDGAYHLHEVSPDGVWSDSLPLTEGAEPIDEPNTLRMIGASALVGDDQRYTFFDPADQQVWDGVLTAFKGQRVHLASWTANRRKLVVMVDSPQDGQDYAIIDLDTHKAAFIGSPYDALKADDISPVKSVRFKARDGLELTGYLTLPHGRDPKNLPLVMFPHGGPAARDEPGFDWWAQAMASRGYAVLQVEYRGSDGYGWEFMKAGFGQWGRKMQTDLTDGVHWLAAQGTIDPKRVCIVGASYGGYAAMAGPTLDPDTYRCAVAYAGVSELRRMVAWSKEQNGKGAERYWERFMGADKPDDPRLVEVSPADHADRVKAPMLLIHGKDDTTVPLEQSRIMADAMRAAGKPVEFMILDSTDHWLTKGATRLTMLKATTDFLEKNNPPN